MKTCILNIIFVIVAIILFRTNDLISRIIQVELNMLPLLILFSIIYEEKKKIKKKKDELTNGAAIANDLGTINFGISACTVNTMEIITNNEGEKATNGAAIAIDLGTTNFRVGVYKDNKMEIITNDEGEKATPSYVAFTATGEVLIGDKARNQLIENPENTISNIQRLLGRDWSDQIVQETMRLYPFRIIKSPNGKPLIKIQTLKEEKTYTPEWLCSLIVGEMKKIAEKRLGEEVTHAVVTIPANYNDAQRQATIKAVTTCGLEVMRLVNAPSAVAITYGQNTDPRPGQNGRQEKKIVLFYTLGGGNFDTSLISIDNGVYQVLSTHGSSNLGGENFNHRVIDHFIQLYETNSNIDLRGDKKILQKLHIQVEEAKIALSTSKQVPVTIKSFFEGNDFKETLTRSKFEELNKDLFDSTIESIKTVLKDARMSIKDVDEVVLVGGSSRIPRIQQFVKDFFEGKELYQMTDSDVAIVSGGAAQASVLSGDEQVKHITLIDVTPLSLGTDIIGGYMSVIIPRNTSIPTTKSGNYTTSYDNQTTIPVEVYEGEHPMYKDNHLLGEFKLTGIPPAPRHVPKIDVSFQLDCNGILHVSAKDRATGNRNQIVINYQQKRLSPEDGRRMMEDAKILAA